MSFAPHRVAHQKRERLSASVERVLAVLVHIDENPVSTIGEIHEAIGREFECCRRSIRRDIYLLCDLGLVEATQGFVPRFGSFTYETTGVLRVSIQEAKKELSQMIADHVPSDFGTFEERFNNHSKLAKAALAWQTLNAIGVNTGSVDLTDDWGPVLKQIRDRWEKLPIRDRGMVVYLSERIASGTFLTIGSFYVEDVSAGPYFVTGVFPRSRLKKCRCVVGLTNSLAVFNPDNDFGAKVLVIR